MAEKSENRLGIITTLAIAFVLSLWGALLLVITLGVQKGAVQSLWVTVGDGQAQIISSSIAALGILTSAVLVPFVFKDRIRGLDDAVAGMKGTIEGFETDAGKRLEALTNMFDEKIAEVERRAIEDADRIGEMLEEIRSAVILSVSEGHISDPKHAKIFVRHLYNDAVAALHRRVREKPYLREVTRAQIAELRTMSKQYLNKLLEAQIITQSERSIVDRVKEFAYRRTDFVLSDINEINKARSEFDRAFSESAILNADA